MDIILSKNLGGLIAEECVKAMFNKVINEKKLDAEVIETIYTSSLDQIDLKLRVGSNIKTIEVRSSFSYKTSFERIFEGAFSIIGPYITKNKLKEVVKDYYIFVLHFYHPSSIRDMFKKEVTVFIITGASKENLSRLGENKTLKQGGATYRVINPITKAPDVIELLNEIFEVK